MSIKSRDRIYGTGDAAKFLKLATDTVRQYVHRGLLKPLESVGGRYFFEESELKRYNVARQHRGRQKTAG